MPSSPLKLPRALPSGAESLVSPQTVYLVGGSVRDRLLGRQPLDYDLAVAVEPQIFARRLASLVNGRLVQLGKSDQTIYRVVSSDHIFDVSKLTGPTIEADLGRRDFTINAMAVDAATGDIIDIFGGRADLLSGRIRMVSGAVFREDPVRLVRAFRLAAAFDFQLTRQTVEAVHGQASLITGSAGERTWAELIKTLEAFRTDHHVRQMADCGLLQAILPEFRLGRTHQRWNRALEAYRKLEKLLIDASPIITHGLLPEMQTPIEGPAALLKFAFLLQHFVTPAPGRDEGLRNHQSGPTDAIRRRLKLSNQQAQYIDFITRHHMKPRILYAAYQKKHLSDTAVSRFFTTTGGKLPDLMLNAAAVVTVEDGTVDGFRSFAHALLQRYHLDFMPRRTAPPFITGKDLIEHFNLAPSPAFRLLLNRIENDRLAGRIVSKGQAFERVDQLLQDGRFGDLNR
jgi:tRNA nucleotidyltransferase/poly(A) polymerase